MLKGTERVNKINFNELLYNKERMKEYKFEKKLSFQKVTDSNSIEAA